MASWKVKKANGEHIARVAAESPGLKGLYSEAEVWYHEESQEEGIGESVAQVQQRSQPFEYFGPWDVHQEKHQRCTGAT